MKKLLMIIISTGLLLGLGVETLNIPPTANAAGISGAGIASPGDIWINPTAIHSTKRTNIRFTYFRWLGGVPGNQIALNWKSRFPQHLALESSIVDDLDLYGDIPEADPLGKFSTSWVSAVYSIGLNIRTFQTGISLRANYSRLYTETMAGITVDFGTVYKMNDILQFGFVIKNVGFETSDNLRTVLPMQMGTGLSYIEPLTSSSLLLDVIQDKNNGTIIRGGIRKSFAKLTAQAGVTIQDEEFIIGSGISFFYRNWKISWGTLVHSRSVLGIPQYLDIAWYF